MTIQGSSETVAKQWLSTHRRFIGIVLVLASVLIRLIYFSQLNSTELIEFQRWDETDMHYYDAWGRAIADGDWLSRSVGVPMNSWHVVIAQQYLESHPNEAAVLERQSAESTTRTTLEAALWSKWMEGHRFYEDPLYPYLVGLTYRVAGEDVRYVFAWQLIVGVATNLLIWTLTRRFFGDLTAAIAALMAVLCGPLVYYELVLLRESLIVFAGPAIIWLTDRAWRQETWRAFGALGLAFGLACLLKSTFFLLGGLVALGTIYRYRMDLRARLLPLCAAVAAFVVALMPLAIRNVMLGVPPFAFASSGPLTFIIANAVNYRVQAGFVMDTRQVGIEMADTYGRPVAAVIDTIRQHTVREFARLLWRKWTHAWHWYNIPNNENFYYMRRRVPVLGWLAVTFWAVAPLGLVGLAIGFGRPPRPRLLLALVLSTFAPMMLFYVLGRFRVALLAALIPFAALALSQILGWLLTARYQRLALAAAAIVLLGVWTGRPRLPDQPLIRSTDWLSPYRVRFQAEAQAAVDRRDARGAAAALLAFFQYEPDTAQLLLTGSRDLDWALGSLHRDCANFLEASGQPDLAKIQMTRADEILRLMGPVR